MMKHRFRRACVRFADQVQRDSTVRRTLIISHLFFLPTVGVLVSVAVSFREIVDEFPGPNSPALESFVHLIWGLAGLITFSYGSWLPLTLLLGLGYQQQTSEADRLQDDDQKEGRSAC